MQVTDFICLPLYFYPPYRKNRFSVRVPTDCKPCRTLIFVPRDVHLKKQLKVVLHLHGGGWTICRPETEAGLCCYLADQGVLVVAPDYCKAPENPFPAALEQLHGLLGWIADGSLEQTLQARYVLPSSVSIDVQNIACTGASAGGNLAVSLSLYTMLKPLSCPCRIASLGLLYPALKLSGSFEEKLSRVDPKHILSPALARIFLHSYVGTKHTVEEPLISPCLASPEYLKQLPQCTIITASRDYLAWEGEQFAELLRSHGVQVTHLELQNVGHAFDGIPVLFDHNQRKTNGDARQSAWALIALQIEKGFATS